MRGHSLYSLAVPIDEGCRLLDSRSLGVSVLRILRSAEQRFRGVVGEFAGKTSPYMATLEAAEPRTVVPALEDVTNLKDAVEDDPKAALKGALVDDENEDQVLFSCNICYEVR